MSTEKINAHWEFSTSSHKWYVDGMKRERCVCGSVVVSQYRFRFSVIFIEHNSEVFFVSKKNKQKTQLVKETPDSIWFLTVQSICETGFRFYSQTGFSLVSQINCTLINTTFIPDGQYNHKWKRTNTELPTNIGLPCSRWQLGRDETRKTFTCGNLNRPDPTPLQSKV